MQKSKKKHWLTAGLCLMGVILLLAVIYFTIGKQLLIYYNKLIAGVPSGYIDSPLGSFLYCVLYISLMAIGLPLVGPLSLIGGRLFGFYKAIIISLAAIVFGSFIYILFIRYFIDRYTSLSSNVRLNELRAQVKAYGYWYLLSLHFMVLIPLFFINAIVALEHVPFFTFAIITMIGSLPIVAVYAYTGNKLSYIKAIGDVVQSDMVVALVLCAMCALLPMVIQYIRKKSERNIKKNDKKN